MTTAAAPLVPAPEAESAPPPTVEQAAESILNQEELEGSMALGAAASRLPVELDVSIAVSEFRVRNLLALEPGQVIETHWSSGQDLPLAARRVQIAWSEFEVVEQTLAVRITHLA